MTKPSVVFRTQTLSERKFQQNHDSPVIVNPGRALVYSVWNPATQERRDYSTPVSRLVVKTLTGDGAIIDPVPYNFVIQEVRVRIISPATASATGAIEIDGTPVAGCDTIALDAAAGTIAFAYPTVTFDTDHYETDGTELGSSGDDISLDVTGDTNGTLKCEVEVLYKPMSGFTVTP